uniref:Putative secreted protein n=1 Tax=Anopheles marajoara TaxID=58244 RepID=A0A2M4CBY5_9DIPT
MIFLYLFDTKILFSLLCLGCTVTELNTLSINTLHTIWENKVAPSREHSVYCICDASMCTGAVPHFLCNFASVHCVRLIK